MGNNHTVVTGRQCRVNPPAKDLVFFLQFELVVIPKRTQGQCKCPEPSVSIPFDCWCWCVKGRPHHPQHLGEVLYGLAHISHPVAGGR